jgi:uncharacterized protein
MEDENFLWDDDKAARNWRDHAVTFEMARDAFRDPFAIEWEDTEQARDEERYSMIGWWKTDCCSSATPAGAGKSASFTARKAEPHERRRYHEENREA